MFNAIDPSQYTNKIFDGDVEAKGFLDEVHKAEEVWCFVFRDKETAKVWVFHDYPEYDNATIVDDGVEHVIPPRDGTLKCGVQFLYNGIENGSKFRVHNCLTYDKWLVEKIWPEFKTSMDGWIDTYVQSKVQYADRPTPRGARSGHGLAAYGIRSKRYKPAVEDFSIMNAFMLHRCIVDVDIQYYCSEVLDAEAKRLSTVGIDFTHCMGIEREYTWNCAKQEYNGAFVDREHIIRCLEIWDKRLDELKDIVEPQLPPTVKPNGSRVTRSELMRLLGYPESKIPPDPQEKVKQNGEMILKPRKPYFQPTTTIHKVVKTKKWQAYSAFGDKSPEFAKKNELTRWIKEQHPKGTEAKVKELTEFVKTWEFKQNEYEEVLLNKNTCVYFEVEPHQTDVIVGAHTKVKFLDSELTQHEVVKGMLIKMGIKYAEEWNLKKDENGQIVKAEHAQYVNYPKKAAPENQMSILVKEGEAILTSPKFGDKEYEQLPEDCELGQQIVEYNTTVHRRRFFSNPKDPESKGILAYIDERGRIPCGVNNFATSTGRAAHRVWVNAPSAGAKLGQEIRSAIIAPEGRVLVSSDMKSAQLSIAAFFAKNYEYYQAVMTGQEIKTDDEGKEVMHPDTGEPWYLGESGHCFNARAFDLVSQDEWRRAVESQDAALIKSISMRRKKSKGGTFATLFGASGKKVALTLGIEEALGAAKRKNFLEEIGLKDVHSTLKTFEKRFKPSARAKGWFIPLPMGYWVYCDTPHKAGNYLIQGTEAVAQKIAVNYFERKVIEENLDVIKILDYHRPQLLVA